MKYVTFAIFFISLIFNAVYTFFKCHWPFSFSHLCLLNHVYRVSVFFPLILRSLYIKNINFLPIINLLFPLSVFILLRWGVKTKGQIGWWGEAMRLQAGGHPEMCGEVTRGGWEWGGRQECQETGLVLLKLSVYENRMESCFNCRFSRSEIRPEFPR